MLDEEDGIAVVGIGCNFPGGEGLENFWKVLLNGKNCSVPIPKERFDLASWYDPDESKAGKSCTAMAALIDGFNDFDHKFFGISDSEVEQMDPQQKQLLQCVFRALENAGIPLEQASGTRTGVFFGIMNRDYETNAAHMHPSLINHWTGTGLAMSIAANRVSYTFNFTGPSLSIDSACSSSLVALHLACSSIKQGDCDMAVCGGVNCIIEPRVFVALSKAKMISPGGTSKPFSSRADGYGRGEGCGVVLLKPLKKALQDRNNIWGIISKTAVNQDGHSVTPITKPSLTQQEELLRKIYSKSDIAKIEYIEAHGTGTPVGDPTEAESISNVIAEARPPDSGPLWIGSVKSNIGHTESAAGIAGLIKVLLMMKHETIVPSLFYSDDFSTVNAKAFNVIIPTESLKWECSGPRVAGVNNFGFGGTNAHAIVKQHLCVKQKIKEKHVKYFVLSANSCKSLFMMMKDTVKQLEAHEVNLDSLVYTSACRRSHQRHRYRKAILVSSIDELTEKLTATASKNVAPAISDPQLAFVFCGNGTTYHGMCKQLLKCEPVFRDKIKEINQLFQYLSPLNVLETLESESESCDFKNPEISQSLLFAIQVGITTLLRHWGVKPDVMLGHSVGEVAAAHCSGLLSLEDAVKVLHIRSSLQNTVTGGKMLVIGNMAVSKVTSLLPSYVGKLCVAAFNSPQSCTLSGDAEAIRSIHEFLSNSTKYQNIFLHVLDVPAAYHSHLMDPILPEIKERIGTLTENDLNSELFSTVTGARLQHGDFCSGGYWLRNIREPVAFESALRSAVTGKNTVFVEIGPRRVLQRNIKETLGDKSIVLASVEPEKDQESMVLIVSKLFELGVHVDWDTFYRGYETSPLDLPRYQFDCDNRDIIIGAANANRASSHPVLCYTRSDRGHIFSCDLMSESTLFLSEHKHNNIPIIPGSFYAELGFAAFLATTKRKVSINTLQLSVDFQSPFVLIENSPKMMVQLELKEDKAFFTVFSSSAVYASGLVVLKKERPIEERFISLSSIYNRCPSVMSFVQLYNYLSQGGFQYGEIFKNKADVHYGEHLKEAVAAILVPEELQSQLHEYNIHPVILDYLMQLLPVTVEHMFGGRPGFPARIGSLTMVEPLQNEMIVYLRAVDVGEDHFEVCGCFVDKEGRVLVEVKHIEIRYIGSHSSVVEEYFYHNAFNVTHEAFIPSPPKKVLVFCDHSGNSYGLEQFLDSTSLFVPFPDDFSNKWFHTLVVNLDVERNFEEVLFLWGKEDLTSLASDIILRRLVNYCETLRIIILQLKQVHFPKAIRALTYHSSDLNVDYISPGFSISGMMRSFAAEIPDLSFQLIDIGAMSTENVAVLSEVLRSFPCSRYPELVVKEGEIYKPSIVRTPLLHPIHVKASFTSATSEHCIFHTADAHEMSHLRAILFIEEDDLISGTSVEIWPRRFCVHSFDYFPVSTSHLKFGQTLYWNKHSSQTHELLVLDFSGTITNVGADVKKLKVGDHVVACYPVVGGSKIRVPEDVCHSTKRFSFLKNAPCVSFFVLAWEILNRALSKDKQNLGIMCSVPESVLVKVLALTAHKSGWKVTLHTKSCSSFPDESQVNALVILPPMEELPTAKISHFSKVQHIVVICGLQAQGFLSQEVLQTVKENIQVQTIQMQVVLQKGYLKAHCPHIHRWIKSLKINKEFSIENFTFQSLKSETKSFYLEKPASYFSSKELGTVVLENDGSDLLSDIPLMATRKQLFRKRAVYIIAGGLSGLGFETVKFISQRGGEKIVILSRSKPTPEVREEIHKVEKQCGNTITSMECDISVSAHVHQVITTIQKTFPGCPIRGVFHSAVVLHDGLIENLNKSLYKKVLKPKVSGVLNLHHATLSCPLEYFVCYSSISAFLGNAAQTNYAAANSFLDLFCQYRRKLGLPAQSINWGALNLGLLLNKEQFHRFLEAKGMMVLDVAEIHQSLEFCLKLNRPQQAVCRFHFRNIRYNILSQNNALTMRLSVLVNEAFQKSNIEDSQTKQVDSISPRDYVASLLRESVSMDQSKLRDEATLLSLGIDSLQAMTLQNQIFQERGVNVPLVKLLDPNATLSTLVTLLSGEAQKPDFTSESPHDEDMGDVFTWL